MLREPPPGHYFPRIARYPLTTPRDGETQKAAAATATTLGLLLRDLRQLLEVVELDDRNLGVFGHAIRRALLLACMEVESGWGAVLRANRYHENGRWTTRDYVKLSDAFTLPAYRVAMHEFSGREPLRPFEGWSAEKPTESLPWYAAYNRTKHDRERNLQDATLGNLLLAVSACYVLACAQFGSHVFGPDSEIGQSVLYLAFEPSVPRYITPGTAGLKDWQEAYYPF